MLVLQGVKEKHVVPEVTGDEKVFSHMLATVLPEVVRIDRILQQLFEREGSSFNGVRE